MKIKAALMMAMIAIKVLAQGDVTVLVQGVQCPGNAPHHWEWTWTHYDAARADLYVFWYNGPWSVDSDDWTNETTLQAWGPGTHSPYNWYPYGVLQGVNFSYPDPCSLHGEYRWEAADFIMRGHYDGGTAFAVTNIAYIYSQFSGAVYVVVPYWNLGGAGGADPQLQWVANIPPIHPELFTDPDDDRGPIFFPVLNGKGDMEYGSFLVSGAPNVELGLSDVDISTGATTPTGYTMTTDAYGYGEINVPFDPPLTNGMHFWTLVHTSAP